MKKFKEFFTEEKIDKIIDVVYCDITFGIVTVIGAIVMVGFPLIYSTYFR